MAVPSKQQVKEATETNTAKQVSARRTSQQASVAATSENERWQADLVSFQALGNTKGNKTFTFFLLCIDTFSRKVRGEPVKGKSGPVIAAALKKIFEGAVCKVLDTDSGGEWGNPEVAALCAEKGVIQQFKPKEDRNGLAVADRAVGLFKQLMHRLLKDANSSVWQSRAGQVLTAMNERSVETLGGSRPNDVEDSADLRHVLLRKNTAMLERNAVAFQKMTRGVTVGSLYRSPVASKQRGFRRAADAKFSNRVYTVTAILNGGRAVRGSDGKIWQTKLILPVAPRSTQGGNALQQAARARTAQVRVQRAGVD